MADRLRAVEQLVRAEEQRETVNLPTAERLRLIDDIVWMLHDAWADRRRVGRARAEQTRAARGGRICRSV